MKRVERKFLILISLFILLSMVGCGGNGQTEIEPPKEQESVKETKKDSLSIALLLPGPINDASWNAAAYEGLMRLEKKGHEVTYTENVPVPNIEEAFRNYAEQGYDLIIGHGFEFGEPALRVAPQFPDTWFFISGKAPEDIELLPNVGFVDQKEYEGAYLCGILAGMMTKTNKVGFIAALEIPSQLADMAAYKKAVESVNPDAEVMTVILGSSEDPPKGKEAANAQIDNGADVIMHVANSSGIGVIEACKAKSVYVIGYGGDQNDLAPDLILTSMYSDMARVIEMQVDKIEEGTFSGIWKAGIADGVVDIAPYHGLENVIPEEAKQKVEEIKQDIIDGKFIVPEIYERI